MTSERAQQLIYLLSTILHLAGNSVSSKDAAIMAFFRTAEHFNIQEPTVRDMVTRSCGVCGIASFHNAIGRLYDGDSLTFKNLYFHKIPSTCHVEINALCRQFSKAKKTVPESSADIAFFLKKFIKSRNPDEKRALLNLLHSELPASA